MSAVPPEYDNDFGFSFTAVDDPTSEQPAQPQQASPELIERMSVMEGKLDDAIRAIYAIREDGDERASEAELKARIKRLEAVIVPLLNNLLKTSDKAYIYWPNRREAIEKQLALVLSLTRGDA